MRYHDRVLFLEDTKTMLGCDCEACGSTDANGRHMVQRCHPRAGLVAAVIDGYDDLYLACAQCGERVTTVAIAPRPPEMLS